MPETGWTDETARICIPVEDCIAADRFCSFSAFYLHPSGCKSIVKRLLIKINPCPKRILLSVHIVQKFEMLPI